MNMIPKPFKGSIPHLKKRPKKHVKHESQFNMSYMQNPKSYFIDEEIDGLSTRKSEGINLVTNAWSGNNKKSQKLKPNRKIKVPELLARVESASPALKKSIEEMVSAQKKSRKKNICRPKSIILNEKGLREMYQSIDKASHSRDEMTIRALKDQLDDKDSFIDQL